jgi:hypothetical protein
MIGAIIIQFQRQIVYYKMCKLRDSFFTKTAKFLFLPTDKRYLPLRRLQPGDLPVSGGVGPASDTKAISSI